MKKILIYILLTISIYANEDIKELEGIFFKMGIEAFLKDFENEKNITSNQQKMIEFLSSKVYDHEILLKKISQDKDKKQNNINLNNNNDLLLIGKKDNNLKEIYKKIDKMEKEIKFYKDLSMQNEKKLIELKSKKINRINNIQNVLVNKDNTPLRVKPFSNAKVIRTLKIDSIIYIESCDKYGWCKVRDEDGYIAKYLLKFNKD